jgi:hypothetical protein
MMVDNKKEEKTFRAIKRYPGSAGHPVLSLFAQ